MNEFTAVFEITAQNDGVLSEAASRIGIGVIVLVAGIVGLYLHKTTKGQFPKKLWTPIFMIAWAIFWILVHIPMWRSNTSTIDHLLRVYQNGETHLVEGLVTVTHQQPAEGHAPGDKIVIRDQEFEVNYFRSAPAYNRTIAYGGALRQGVCARLHHYHGLILKVEIKPQINASCN